MPELPDIVVYEEALQRRVVGATLERITLHNPFLVRSFEPPLETAHGKRVQAVGRLGKRLVLHLDDELALVLHLMIAGRLHWRPLPGTKSNASRSAAGKGRSKIDQATFGFSTGSLILTEAGTQRRASLYLVAGEEGLWPHRPGGLELFTTDLPAFQVRLTTTNHTLKRALTDPHLFSGIGNAYSDEILHAARLSPLALTQRLTGDEIARLFETSQTVLATWIDRLRTETGTGFPEKVTAFRPDMAVHGKFGQPCPACGAPVQRIRYADNETNYCARCQTDGKVLADRSLSRLLKDDWPRNIDDWS